MNQDNKSNKEIKELYKNFFNIGQVGLLDKFEFSKDSSLAVVITCSVVLKLYTNKDKSGTNTNVSIHIFWAEVFVFITVNRFLKDA